MPFIAYGEKEETSGRFFMGGEGRYLGWQEFTVKLHWRLMDMAPPCVESPKAEQWLVE